MAASASEAWANAQKVRRAVLKVIDQIQKPTVNENILDQLKGLEELMAEYRLACIGALWLDMQYAAEQKVEIALWQTHIFLNAAYRKLVNNLAIPQQAVLRRKIEKLYLKYLKVSQSFYKGYMQRLCARYSMPELERIVQGAEVDKMTVPDTERIDPVAAGIGDLVIASCHNTLTYMGDLARYRSLARPNGRNFESSLTYYSLANDLMPDSGAGYHQMGLIFLEQKKPVEIVYHFYRALAAVKPHPNASGNLDVEFRKLLRPSTPKTQSPYDAFAFWFVRLHAFFHRGEEFTQQAELEEEVLHRLSMAMKADDFGQTLLKMVLINICAYQIAQANIKAEWTASGSQSCQFILGFNVRTILVIARVIRTELVDLNKRPGVPEDGQVGGTVERSGMFTSAVRAGLPLLRVYMTWLCAYGADIVQFEAHLEPYLGEMYKTLSQALSGLFELLDANRNVGKTVPYLLEEDIQTLGLKCLDNPDLPAAGRLSVDPVQYTRKPRAEELGELGLTPDDVAFSRALDIVACSMPLVDDAVFPFTTRQVKKGSRELTEVIYLEEGKSQTGYDDHIGISDFAHPGADIGDLTTMLGNLRASPAAKGMESALPGPSVEPADVRAPPDFPAEALAGYSAEHLYSSRSDATEAARPTAATDPEYSMDSQLYGLVNDFLAPPESSPHEGPHGQDETSYGMHSSTADEVFGAARVSPTPGSATKKSFPSLPWSYFYTPVTQQRSLRQEAARQEAAQQQSWNGPTRPVETYPMMSPNRVRMQGFENLDDPFTKRTEVPAMNYSHARAAAATRNHGLGQQMSQTLGGSEGIGSSSHGGGWNSQTNADVFEHAGHPGQLRTASVHAGPMDAPFSSLAFSANTSSLPPVNSPRGIPWDPMATVNHPSGTSQNVPYSAVYSQPNSASKGFAYGNGNGYDAQVSYGHGQLPDLQGSSYFENSGQGSSTWSRSMAGPEAYGPEAFYGAAGDGTKHKR